METASLPATLDEVVSLILALYEPRPPETISQIQETLQQVQKSPAGWQLAQNLLMRSDDKVKFFGALTLIVKLNTESSTLDTDAAEEILQNLIGWLLASLRDGSGAIVVRKLCSALSTFFVHFSGLWTRCVRHLLYCFDLGRSVPTAELDQAPPLGTLIDDLDLPRLQAALWFAASLVEDVGKTDLNSVKYIHLHERLVSNAQEVVSLLHKCLSPPGNTIPQSGLAKLQEEAIKCYQSWVLYAQRTASSTNETLVTPLRTLVEPVLTCLAVDALFSVAAELFSDTLSNYSGFFTRAHYSALASVFESEWAQTRYRELVQGDFDFEPLQFGLLMIAFGDARVQTLIESADNRSQNLLVGLSGLLAASGYPVGEDKIFVPALEFWSTFVETAIDSRYSSGEENENPPWMARCMDHIMRVISHCWQKCRFPSAEVFASWDSTERTGFGDARKDVADLLQSVYTLSGPQLLSLFAEVLLRSMPTRAWSDIEAAAFCLSALSDCVSDQDTAGDVLRQVFASPFFDMLSQAREPIPVRLRQTGLSLIERYSEYFERHSQFLPAAISLLFAAVDDPLLGGPSSRSVATLCSSCRSLLTGELGAFLGHFEQLRLRPSLDSLAEERIVVAIASIIQAVPDETQRLLAFNQLFELSQNDVSQSSSLQAHPDQPPDLSNPLVCRGIDRAHSTPDDHSAPAVALQLSLRALRCLASAAKGMQAIAEAPVDLDADVQSQPRSTALVELQDKILATLSEVQRLFPDNSEVVEPICTILRAGFSEAEQGPFVFPPGRVTEFFVGQTLATPRIGIVVSTACSFVSSLSSGSAEQGRANLSRLLPWVIGLLQGLEDFASDTELSQHGIDFVHRVLSKYPAVLLLQANPAPSVGAFFMFTLDVMNGKEPLPKAAAADFWTAFLSLKSQAPALQAAVDDAMQHLGPPLALALVGNVGGGAARSELDRLSDPLRKLVVAQPRAQRWLEDALTGGQFPGAERVSREERAVFLREIVSLRGARQTNQVVREFWLACRGSNFAYAS